MSVTSRASATTVAVLLLAAPAATADPLLSGYSGPGGGDQRLLGAELLPAPSGSGSGSGSARGGSAQGGAGGSLESAFRGAVPAVGSAPVAVIAAAAPLSPEPARARPQPARDRQAPARSSESTRARGTVKAGRAAGSTPQVVPAARTTVRYAAATAGAGALLGTEAILVLLLAVVALAVLALVTRRLAKPGDAA